jgi:hypothetical protein
MRFLQEYIILLIVVYRSLFEHYFHHKVLLDPSIDIYVLLLSLPISELLAFLDDFSTQFCQLSEKYELTNSQLSWSEWFEKYWWSPPAMIITLARVALRYTRALVSTLQTMTILLKGFS